MNAVKLSDSSTRNIAAVITSHNQNVLNSRIENFGCNCRNKLNYPLDNKCLTPKMIYEAKVTYDRQNDEKIHFGFLKKYVIIIPNL